MASLSLTTRMHWMDAVRGIAIILVIVWHAFYMADREGIEVPAWAIRANHFFLPYRMPTLMFLSGLLLTASLRKPTFQYYAGKVRLLIWPYFVWTLVYILVVGTEYPIYHPRAWFLQGGPYWFIAFIAAYYLIAPLIKRVPAWIVPVVLLISSILVDSGFLYFGAFFFLGRAASVYRDIFERIVNSRWMLAGVLVACAFGVYAMFVDVEHLGQYALLEVAGIFASIWLVRRIENRAFVRPLKYMGRKSLIFYVSHVPVISVCLDLARFDGISDPAVLIPCCISVALLAGYALTLVDSTRAGHWLFEMPRIDAFPRRKKTVSREA